MIKIGAHTTFSKGNKEGKYLIGSGAFAKRIKANAMMIYLGAPRNYNRADTSEYMLDDYMKEYAKVVNPKDIIIHAPYIINPSSPEKFKFAEQLLIKDSERMNYIGAELMVIHPGSHTNFSRTKSIDVLVRTMQNVIEHTQDTIFCLETMSGKGTEVGIDLEEMQYIMEKINSDRIAICLDTCHMWDAGYDMKNVDSLINSLKDKNILKKVKVLHINDSKNIMGSSKDRHENIGKGKIGLEALKKIVHHEEFAGLPMILETPYVDKKDIYAHEIKQLLI